ncbi:Ppx/GppA family phosphatase [Rossellomorea aquimaris]|uniref:Ppx/GppA family phosphatase n=1 Tax=Rossellomorea aquimaris TaxID=189382 RepID=UPI0007D065D5|nr:Ppx/GppA family phosphatase [Rossellomorea aquimaris]
MGLHQHKSAIIDVGSNTIRLVIHEHYINGQFKEIENVKTVARLRNYLDESNYLTSKGINVLLEILVNFKEVADFHRIEKIRCVATATIRQAKNQTKIVESVFKKTGFQMEILSEKQEAYYGYYAVVNNTPIDTGVTIDIGGGSTEITYFENKKMIYFHSFPFGVVSLNQMFTGEDPLTDDTVNKLKKFLIDQFSTLDWLKDKRVPIVMIGGSARNIAQVHQHRVGYSIAGVHQYQMSGEELATLRSDLLYLSASELKKIEGLSSDRFDIILPALEVFFHLYHYSQASFIMFSRKGLRDGIVLDEMEETVKRPWDTTEIIENSIKELEHDYSINPQRAEHSVYLTESLQIQFSKLGILDDLPHQLKLVRMGAYLYYLGKYIDAGSSSQHTFYIIANRSINGLYHKERISLACLASFKSKSTLFHYLTPFTSWFSKEEMKKLREWGALIKLAYSLNTTKRKIVKEIKVQMDDQKQINIHAFCSGRYLPEKYQVEKQKKHLEKALKLNINVHFHLLEFI